MKYNKLQKFKKNLDENLQKRNIGGISSLLKMYVSKDTKEELLSESQIKIINNEDYSELPDKDFKRIKIDNKVNLEIILYPSVLDDTNIAYYIQKELIASIHTYFEKKISDKMLKNEQFYDDIINRALMNYSNKIFNGALELVNSLIKDKYESRLNLGVISFVKTTEIAQLQYDKFYSPIDFNASQKRLIRKLLEITKAYKSEDTEKLVEDSAYSIIVECDKILGLGKTQDYHGKKIKYYGNSWAMDINGDIKIVYRDGKYLLEKIKAQELYNEKLNEVKGLLDSDEFFNRLIELICALEKSNHHGGLIIILPKHKIKKNADRLANKNRGIKFEKCIDFRNVNSIDNFIRFCSIDGAIMLDTSLQCYGIGYILDGKAREPGRPDRGSRYNSAKCFIDNCYSKKNSNKENIAIVLSEDGGIDVYTK